MSAVTRQRLRLGLLLAVILGVVWIGWLAKSSLVPFMVGLLFAWLLAPVVDLLSRQIRKGRFVRRHDRLLAVVIVYVVGLGTLVGIGFVLVPFLADQTRDLYDSRQDIVDNLEDRFSSLIEFYQERLPEEIQTGIEDWFNDVTATAPTAALDVINHNLTTLFGFVVVPFWLFVFVKDQPKVTAWLYSLFPEQMRPDVRNIAHNASRIFGRYLRMQLLLGLFVGVITLIPLLILDIQYAGPLAITAGILELVTIVGPIIATIVAVGVTLSVSTVGNALVVLVVFIGVQQVENYILVPRIQGRALSIHPALVIFLIVIAATAFGLLGVFLVLPVTAILRDSFGYVYRRLGEAPRHAAIDALSGLENAPEHPELEPIRLPAPEELLEEHEAEEALEEELPKA